MNKWFSLLVGCVWGCLFACASPDAPSFALSMEIDGLKEGTRVVLSPVGTGGVEKPLAMGELVRGRTVLTGSVDSPCFCRLVFHDGKHEWVRDIVLGNESIALRAVVKEGGRGKPVWEEFALAGAFCDSLFWEKIAFEAEEREKVSQREEPYRELQQYLAELQAGNDIDELVEMMRKPEVKRMRDDIMDAMAAYGKNVRAKMRETLEREKDSFWGPLLLTAMTNREEFPELSIEERKEIFDSFSDEAKATFHGERWREVLYPELAKKGPLPAFSGQDRNGKVLSDKEIREGKKCVIVDFWASWCGPCRQTIPFLKTLYADYADKGLEIVSVSVDQQKAAWLKALDEERMPWPNLLDTDYVFTEKFGGRSVPLLIVVDADGDIVARDLNGDALRAKVREVLKL